MIVTLIALILLVTFLAYIGLTFKHKVAASKVLIEAAIPYEKMTDDHTVSILVLGDSTAVGVGAARPEESVAGLLAEHVGATYVENHALSGARVADLPPQIDMAMLAEYSYIIIAIGGNDIIRFHSAEKAAGELASALKVLPPSTQVIVHSAGNVGGATLFPWPITSFHTALNLKYHAAFADTVTDYGGTYIDLYVPPREDVISQEPEIYLAKDGLHPSSKGYALWFLKIAPHIVQ